jgi:hypothetical protein
MFQTIKVPKYETPRTCQETMIILTARGLIFLIHTYTFKILYRKSNSRTIHKPMSPNNKSIKTEEKYSTVLQSHLLLQFKIPEYHSIHMVR